MFKTRCESCSRLIVCEAVKDDGKSFCAYDCRLNWVRAMRRFEVGTKSRTAANR